MAIPSNWPQTLTALANHVCVEIGESPDISDISTDTGLKASTIRNVIYHAIRMAQSEFQWSELDAFAEIATPDATFDSDDALNYDFSYRFNLPSDYLRPRQDTKEFLCRYKISGQYIYADQSENIDFHYVKYSEDVTEWSSELYNVILYRLSEKVAWTITQSQEVKQAMEVKLQMAEREARRVNSYNKKYPNNRKVARGGLARLRRSNRYGY